ncbi:hypothetical protein VHEMI06382 [[Torrubiella] hemipterigena]|uniref:Thioredoxin peroxidase n=1 Tax=[Torrubiella] hemipterigena TaxID=1531966 RepID=A0A0A1TJA2_9HYPO|nr:hypothetical protein VHEMI06382 [[Torrubiella] hemipterigena]
MSALKVGDSFPQDVSFTWIAPSPENSEFSACGIPQKYNASEIAKDKKIVIVAVPGAFTPTCSANHVPGFIAKAEELKAKGIDQVVFIAHNDAYVMSGWGKANKINDEFIIFASDDETKFSSALGWTLGPRAARYAIVVDHGKVTYAEKEEAPSGVSVSGADAVIAKL